ncbi:MAG: LPS export ABC transporter ATP-binding protein [Acidobacteriota bacterium]
MERLEADERRTLRVEGLSKSYRGRRVVDDLSIAVQAHEIVGLLGPNGAGKTTSFYMVLGLATPDDGRVYLDEEDITELPMYLRAKKGISYLPQEASIFRKLSVEDNILSILETLPMSPSERHEKLVQLMEDLQIRHLAKQKAFTLSGGERRRVEISRLMGISPCFVLLDEPFAGIDPKAVLELQRIVLSLRDQGIGILITDHNVRETLSITDRAYIINDGRVFRSGTPSELAEDPEVRRIYLGETFQLT